MVESYLFYIGIIGVFFIILLLLRKRNAKQQPQKYSLDDLCVIIPFRNEEHNLPTLFNALINQKNLPKNIIFVNDHSTDNSSLLVDRFIEKYQIGKLLQLSENNFGKKKAIRFALVNTESQYCLTLDADVEFDNQFFNSLSNSGTGDMTVRPVIMKSNSFFDHLFSTEYLFFNALNYLLSPLYVLSASGANLIFNKSVFKRVDSYENHKSIPSGDDYFLLRDFQKANATIKVSNLKSDAVYTNGPKSITEYLDQRVRWISKSKKSKDFKELFIGLNLLIYFIGGLGILVYLLVTQNYLLFFYLFIARFIIDITVFLNYTYSLKQYNKAVYLPLFQFMYPFLFLMVIFGAVFYTPRWKDRK